MTDTTTDLFQTQLQQADNDLADVMTAIADMKSRLFDLRQKRDELKHLIRKLETVLAPKRTRRVKVQL